MAKLKVHVTLRAVAQLTGFYPEGASSDHKHPMVTSTLSSPSREGESNTVHRRSAVRREAQGFDLSTNRGYSSLRTRA